MSAAWFVVFAFAQFPLGVALDRIGPRRTVPAADAGRRWPARSCWRRRKAHGGCIVAQCADRAGLLADLHGRALLSRPHRQRRSGSASSRRACWGSARRATCSPRRRWRMRPQQFGWRADVPRSSPPARCAAAAVVLACWSAIPRLPNGQRATRRPPPSCRRSSTLPGLWTLMPLLMLGYAAVVVERGLWVGPYFAEVHGPEPASRSAMPCWRWPPRCRWVRWFSA